MKISEIRCGCGAPVDIYYQRILSNGTKREWFVKCTICGLHTEYYFTRRGAITAFLIATRNNK